MPKYTKKHSLKTISTRGKIYNPTTGNLSGIALHMLMQLGVNYFFEGVPVPGG